MRRTPSRPHTLLALPGLLVAALLIVPEPIQAQTDEQAVAVIVERLFEGMRTRDTTLMRSLFAPNAHLYGVSPDGGVRAMSPDGWIASVGGSERNLDERVFEPQITVDGNLAIVWTFYTLHIDGAFSHCGYDALMLYRLEGGWKIFSLADTRRQENCDRA
jgi:hypothetical protein